MIGGQPEGSLLQLPDPCLVAVLRCCADDPRSICSAARTHSKLHQAAVTALSSITATVNQQQLDDLVEVYLAKYGAHIHSISLEDAEQAFAVLCQLPDSLTQLSSLDLTRVDAQLQPGGGYQGVLGAAAPFPLKQLGLTAGALIDGAEGLIAALARLPGLEHLSIINSTDGDGDELHIPLGEVLPGLQQLTYLELVRVWPAAATEILTAEEAEEDAAHVFDPVAVQMQHLSVLTRLADLRLPELKCRLTASMLSGVQTLTRLQLSVGHLWKPIDDLFDPAVLAGKTLLQHLELKLPALFPDTRGAQLMSHVQHLQHLTCLILKDTSYGKEPCPPAAAYAALTASSKLQHLDICGARVPAGMWQHVFRAGRQLPFLRVLDLSCLKNYEVDLVVPEATRLVSCCPALQSLDIQGLQHNGVGLSALQGLSSLHTLRLHPVCTSTEGLQGVLQLTGLRELKVYDTRSFSDGEGLFVQLTQLRQLTKLEYRGRVNGGWGTFRNEASSDEPVWVQVLRYHLKHPNPVVAEQAAAALAH